MKLLVSVIKNSEVEPALRGGADIIDIKNPAEGSLGAPYPWIISDIIDTVGLERETSCAIGDLPNLPGTVSLAAAGAAKFSPDYIKLGLLGVSEPKGAYDIVDPAVRSIKSVDNSVKVIACGYGDWKYTGSVSPLILPKIALDAGADGVLIDTINKAGKSLIDFITKEELRSFVQEAREYGIICALAGSLRKKHAEILRYCEPDVIGIRGAACDNNDRKKGHLNPRKIRDFKSLII